MPLHRISRPARVESSSAPVLVLLHGLGSNEEDLMGLAPQLDPRLTVVAYRAPLLYGPGYSWFDIQWTETGILFDEDQAAESLQILLEDLREFEGRRLYLGGFSQGAAITYAAVLTKPELFSGALLLSGRMSDHLDQRPDLAGLPCLVQHGVYDPVIPVANGRALSEALIERGANVEYHEYPMGHEVSYESLSDIQDWIGAQL